MADEPAHVRAGAMPLQYQEAALPIHRIKSLLQVDEDPVEWGLFDVSKSAVPVPRPVRQPWRLSCRAIASSRLSITRSMTFQRCHDNPRLLLDKDRDDPPELGGYRALVPDSLDELHQRLPIISGAYICRPLLWVLLQLRPLEPPFQVLCPHPRHSRAAAIGQLCDRNPYFPISGSIIPDFFGTHLGIIGWLQRDKDGGGGDGCRFCGDTHNNQTDHGEGGW